MNTKYWLPESNFVPVKIMELALELFNCVTLQK